MTTDAQVEPWTLIEQARAQELIRRYLEALNTRNPDRMHEIVASDIFLEEPLLPNGVHGWDEYRAFLVSLWEMMPDLEFAPLDGSLESAAFVAADGRRVVMPWRARGTIAATRRAIATHGIEIISFREARVAHVRAYYDPLDFYRQAGLPVSSAVNA